MRWNIIKNLFLINLIYINPQYSSLKRTKYNKKFIKKLFTTHLTIQLIFFLSMAVISIFYDYSNNAGNFKYSVLFLIFFSFLTFSQPFFNMFYEDKDTPNLLILPINEKEIFVSKILSIFFQIFAMSFSFILLNIVTLIKLGNFNIFSLLLILVFSISCIILLSSIYILLFSLIAKSKLFRKNKTVMNVIINLVIFLFALFLGFIASHNFIKNHISVADYKGDLIFNVVNKPFHINTLIFIFSIIISMIISVLLVNKLVIKNYFTDIKNYSYNKKTKIIHTNFNLDKIFRKMTLKSFSNHLIITQNLLAPLFPILMSISSLLSIRKNEYFNQGITFVPIAFILAISTATMMHSSGSFSSIAISIDYKNYEHLKTIPIDIKRFVLNKFYLSSLIQISINSFIFIALNIFLKSSLLFLIVSYLVFLIVSIIISMRLFIKDFSKPFLGWSNIQQLLLRGNSQLKTWLLFFVFLVLFIIIIAINVYIVMTFPSFWYILCIIYSLIIFIISLFTIKNFKNKVLNKL